MDHQAVIQWDECSADRVRLRICAKINPYLRVVQRRPDGYHEVELVLHSVSLMDEIDVVPGRGLAVTCDLDYVPTGPENLAWKAAALLRESAGDSVERGARVRILKRIPVGAGMGGGSADAAAALLALDALWGTRKSPEELHELAARLGSDVPFFLTGGAQSGSGRGEQLRRVAAPSLWLVLVKPAFSVATGWAYQSWQREACGGVPIEEFLSNYALGAPAAIAQSLRNDLEPGVSRGHPEIQTIRRALLDAGALGARMTGSGSVVFGIAHDEGDASRIAASLDSSLGRCDVVRTLATNAPVT